MIAPGMVDRQRDLGQCFLTYVTGNREREGIGLMG